jgi:hypothetical protein
MKGLRKKINNKKNKDKIEKIIYYKQSEKKDMDLR